MLIEKWFLFFTISTIFSLQFRFFDVHMLGQTTRLLVTIALSMVYHTNLRAQKSNVHLITYSITNFDINQYVAEIALLYTIKDLLM